MLARAFQLPPATALTAVGSDDLGGILFWNGFEIHHSFGEIECDQIAPKDSEAKEIDIAAFTQMYIRVMVLASIPFGKQTPGT
jgi:hypothetical protein